QVAPMEDINLHFTGDMHAIGAAHNLLAAMIDNHLAQGNPLNLDSRRIVWRRVMDMNDRALRRLVIGLGGTAHGVPRETGFDITVASEIMAILCLARDLQDFKARVERVVVADRGEGPFVTARELKAAGAMTVLMKDAIKPNLVQTLDGTPAFVHGGPFANIAHGCNSLIATRLALKLGEFVVTEAGFASDLGAEKFVDIKCRTGGLKPSAAGLVTTTRPLATHGEIRRAHLRTPATHSRLPSSPTRRSSDLPFANIAHGCNSLIATRLALKLGEFVVTEAGFASDLGAEKFVDIKCRTGGLKPSAAVIVTTTRALATHGEENLAKHVENVRLYGLAPVVALNHFTD